MLYLSRLIIDLRHPKVRRDMGDAYQLHRTILAAFPQAPDGHAARDHFGLLYRAEALENAPSLMRLLVQSNHQPDWTHLPVGYLGPTPDERGNPSTRRIDQEYARISNGTQLLFRLRANPTKKLSDRTPRRDDPLVGKRVALLREEEQLAWLVRKGGQHGFRLLSTERNPDVPEARAASQAVVRGRRPERGNTPTMTLRFGAVIFSGRLEVSDQAAFQNALSHGIGSGKAFGFGLLSVAAAQ